MKQRPVVVVFLFLYLWLVVGFFAGTVTLLGPVRWLTALVRAASWTQGRENVAVAGVIAAYLIASLALARWLLRVVLRAQRRGVRFGIPLGITVAAAVCLWAWMQPGTLARPDAGPSQRVALASGAQFVFGPYPDAARLRRLKADGFTAVISLLHPAVLPFEPKILAEERRNARAAGLALMHAPMLPWVGSNERSLAEIRRLATGAGRYYVHCYLGRDRANVVKRVLEDMGRAVAGAADLQQLRGFEERSEPFERGPLQRLERGVWLIPYPNQHELFAYLLFGSVRHVVLLLDPAFPQQRGWLSEAERLFREYAMPFTLEPLRGGDAARAAEIARRVRVLPRPVAVVAAFTDAAKDTRVARAFRAAYGVGTQ